MLGAITGDIIGSIYEWRNIKEKDFPLFGANCEITDDSIMTIAVAEGLMNGGRPDDFIDAMKRLGNIYPNKGYGGNFNSWLRSNNRMPYNSWGNGSAMRVSPVGWLFDSLDATEKAAKASAEVTHNHPEGIKGAQATASAIFLARNGKSKKDIKAYIENKYGYDLKRTLDEIRPSYTFNESCQETVPEAIIAFLESNDFEDAIRNAISLGGDSDTLAAIAGSIAEAAYGIPKEIENKVLSMLSPPLLVIVNLWREAFIRPVATKETWENKPIFLPKYIEFKIKLSDAEYALLKRGLVPDAMEDKWFIYFEDDWLYFHRSWTGQGIFKARLLEIDGEKVIDLFYVEGDPEQNKNTNDELSKEIFIYLIGRGLLKRAMPLGLELQKNVLAAWGEFGRMITEEIGIEKIYKDS